MTNLHQAARTLLAEVQQSDAAAMALALAPRIAADPGDHAARLAIATCLWAAGRHRDAVGHYRRLAASHPQLPWTGVLTGLMVLHFYYWGTNQFMVQRALGAKTGWDGRMGIIAAGFFKLLIPFLCIVPV